MFQRFSECMYQSFPGAFDPLPEPQTFICLSNFVLPKNGVLKISPGQGSFGLISSKSNVKIFH